MRSYHENSSNVTQHTSHSNDNASWSSAYYKLIHISPNYWTVYRSFEIFLEWELSTDWNSNTMLSANPLLQKTINLIWIIFRKHFIADGSSGSNGWAQESASEINRENAYCEWYFMIQVTCKMNAKGQTWNENIWNSDKAQWKKPELTTVKQARVLQCKT